MNMKIRTVLTALTTALLLALGTVAAQTPIDDGVLTVAMSGGYPPFSMPAEDGSMEGFDADVAAALAEELGVEVEIVQAQFSGIIAGVSTGRFDASVASHARTPERAEAVTFLDMPYYYGGGQFFAPADSEYDDYEALLADGGTIAVDRGGTNQQWLEDNGYSDNTATYADVPTSLQAIRSGQADAIFTNPIVGNQAFATSGMKMKSISGLVFEENAWITIANGQPGYKRLLELALDELYENGVLQVISERWIGGDIVTPPNQ
ncbi:MAG: transporter substrate-binding domain-containing protein [Trueperaceae bacterium]|nr:transporter substrate-binding domain-containing protein [Trueperaceae bacterium]